MNKILFIALLSICSVSTSFGQLLLEEMTGAATTNFIYDFGQPTAEISRMPGFVGGQAGFAKFMSDYIKYPEDAERQQIGGQVVAEFLVELDGTISHLSLTKQIGHGLDEEVLRVLGSLPKWSPALDKKGEPMKIWMEMPITLKAPKTSAARPKTTKKPTTKSKTGTSKPKKN